MKQANIILGIDPGLATTGYGLITPAGNKLKALAYGTIDTPAGQPFPDRLDHINKQLTKIIKKYKPDVSGCEQLFFCKNVKTALSVGQARGVILLTLQQNKVPISEFTPLQIKQTVSGYGQADKQQVQKMMQTLLNLKDIPRPDDAADALAVAITCLQFINSPLYEK